MLKKSTLLTGTFILTFAGFLTRIMGFFYRILLSRVFSPEELGLYQLIFPVYLLCFSISSGGIQTALSKCTASYHACNKKDKALSTLKIALSISLLTSIFLIIVIQSHASYISSAILGDERCESLLMLIIYGLPFAAFHSCICGYYLGQKNTTPIAVSQFIEQSFRIAAVSLIIFFCLKQNIPLSIKVSVLGLIAGEISACLYIFIFHSSQILISSSITYNQYASLILPFMRLAIPLTANRFSINIMQSIESISIPLNLQKYGIPASEALAVYGVFSGMALPCILFPSALTNAFSSLLLPTVAEYQISKSNSALLHFLQKIIYISMCMGIICLIFFYSMANFIGAQIFHNLLACKYIRILSFLCPFLYTNTTLLTMLNGLGKTTTTFFINMIALSIRIIFVYFLIPLGGLPVYSKGLIFSQFFIFCISYYNLHFVLSQKN